MIDDLRQIERLAKKVRSVMETMPDDKWLCSFGGFPNGQCGDASMVLGAVFADHDIAGFQYVCGWRGKPGKKVSHGWLQRGGLVVDITADQFDECDDPV